MEFPSYEEFNDYLANVQGDVNNLNQKIEKIFSNDPANMKELASLIVNINMMISLDHLRLYHKWLAQHFAQNQQDDQ